MVELEYNSIYSLIVGGLTSFSRMASSNNSEESGCEAPELREGAKFTSFEQLNLALEIWPSKITQGAIFASCGNVTAGHLQNINRDRGYCAQKDDGRGRGRRRKKPGKEGRAKPRKVKGMGREREKNNWK